MKDITEAKDAIGSKAHNLNSRHNSPLTKIMFYSNFYSLFIFFTIADIILALFGTSSHNEIQPSKIQKRISFQMITQLILFKRYLPIAYLFLLSYRVDICQSMSIVSISGLNEIAFVFVILCSVLALWQTRW